MVKEFEWSSGEGGGKGQPPDAPDELLLRTLLQVQQVPAMSATHSSVQLCARACTFMSRVTETINIASDLCVYVCMSSDVYIHTYMYASCRAQGEGEDISVDKMIRDPRFLSKSLEVTKTLTYLPI